MNLGKRLKQAREKRELTQDQLAALVPGASQAMISALESRDSETTTLLFGFAKALQISAEWLQDEHGDSGLTLSIGEPSPPRYGISDEDHALPPLAPDERGLVVAYRKATSAHRLVAQSYLRATPEQRDMLSEEIVTKIFKNHVEDDRLSKEWANPSAGK